MLVLALLLAACASDSAARKFNVTYLDVPAVVPYGQDEVTFECRYDADFTLLSWFKGRREFYRYQPDYVPPIRYFLHHLPGVKRVETITCGLTVCKVKLIGLTEEASGMYRCDLEKDSPPFKFATRITHMVVRGSEYRKPLLEGLATEYKDGDLIEAYCRPASPDSKVRWYINGIELKDFRGFSHLKKKSDRLLFKGDPLTMLVECADFRFGRILFGSVEQTAKWNATVEIRKKEKENEVENGSSATTVDFYDPAAIGSSGLAQKWNWMAAGYRKYAKVEEEALSWMYNGLIRYQTQIHPT